MNVMLDLNVQLAASLGVLPVGPGDCRVDNPRGASHGHSGPLDCSSAAWLHVCHDVNIDRLVNVMQLDAIAAIVRV